MSFSGSGFVLAVLSTVAILASANISYNSKTQLCCNGTVVTVGENSSMSCCGSVPYDYSKSICCNNEILPHPSENISNSACCYSQTTKTWTAYDYNLQMCCDGKAIDKPDPNSYDYSCCKDKLYNYTSHVCCGGEPQEMAPGEACCGEVKMYDTRSEICCTHYGYDEDFNYKLLDYVLSEGDLSTSSCCGLKAYDLTTDMCCNGTVKEKIVNIGEVTWEGCCGDEPYDPKTQVCCNKWGYIREREYGLVESALHGIENGSAMSCCGLALYNVEDEMCCTNDTVKPKPEGCNKDECMICCGDMAITNYTTQICYNEKVIERENFNFLPCGDSGETCDYRSQFCCDNKVYENNSTMACCYGANKAYDKSSHKCCFTTVEQLTDKDLEDDNDACCAVEIYDYQSYPAGGKR